MDLFRIKGGKPLRGSVRACGSKNAALPILLASLLTDEPCAVERVPLLRDIKTTLRLLEALGKTTLYRGEQAEILPGTKLLTSAPYELVKQMRASNLVAGPLLARFRHARVPLPGGCAIGLRPMDIHLKAFEKLGAKVDTEQGDLVFTAQKLRGAHIKFHFPSVGATENLLLCAVLVPGRTVLENAALEPEIDDLAACLNGMGARVEIRKGGVIEIEGVEKLHGASHTVIPDRIEAGTYLLAAAASGGRAEITACRPEHLRALLAALEKSGAKISVKQSSVSIAGPKHPRPVSVATAPYPGFPTDLQAQWLAYMCLASGKSRVRETIFENRFMHAAELARMGARIAVHGNTAHVEGVKKLSGASVMASDLRGGAALVLAAACAEGESLVQRVYHIDRGYFHMEKALSALGLDIRRENPEQ